MIVGSWREHEGLGSCGGKSAREGGEVQRTGAKFLDHILHISENKIFQCTFCLFQILILLNRLKIADARAEYGEMNITKLNQRIDNIEDDIIRAKVGRFL